MQVRFLGATNTVTGSRYLLTQGETKILVDCGLFQGFKNLRLKNWEAFPIPANEIDAIVLTHAHLDHSGYLPLMMKQGFKGPVYATQATIDLCKILLPDSGFLQEEDARFANKRGFSKHHPALPLYTYEDALNSLRLFQPVSWRTPVRISRSGQGQIEFELHPAGHLLGAASVHVTDGLDTIAFSGDLGRSVDPMICNPDPQFGADDLVIESTYGDRRHPQTDPEEELKNIILETQARGGIVLIPSFAVGRAQLILYYLYRLKLKGAIPDLPVYLNSPMAAQANQVLTEHAGELKISPSELSEIWRGVQVISSSEESQALNEKSDPAIIIAASGMATGGRVLHHLKSLAPHPSNTIVFVGFQAGGTRGDLMIKGADQIKIHGQYWPIRAKVLNIESLSAHADADELLAWISQLKRKPKRVFVTHGEPEAADALRHRIEEELGVTALVPLDQQAFRLS